MKQFFNNLTPQYKEDYMVITLLFIITAGIITVSLYIIPLLSFFLKNT